ncbi:MAG: 23S rRNA (adenine(2503)-C(2))-methyltransferase RlmN [Bacteroidales bacterium]|nr:MAG: 23S rRNA (adenine(2503)-C(2))-methyltransferase RlmN [Bacteroidales bacterium]
MFKKNILGLSLVELQRELISLGMPKYTAKQVMEWVYKKKIKSFEQITNISKKNLNIIKDNFDIGLMPYSVVAESKDGTKKYLFPTSNGNVEAVMIPEDDRCTICVSSQVGCKMNCRFCMTGKSGFSGNMTAGEILNQVLSIDEVEEVSNIVFMGMGEPFDNLTEVLRAVEILTAEWGFAFSPKRITVSTSGLTKGIKQFLDNTKCHLAISLHNPFGEERESIMPIERFNAIKEVIALLQEYDFAHQRRLSFEYIVFEGHNDTIHHAQEIVRLLNGLFCRVNLIRFHKVDGFDLSSPSNEKMIFFRDFLTKKGIITTIRRSRGEDISAACGQLKKQTQNHY